MGEVEHWVKSSIPLSAEKKAVLQVFYTHHFFKDQLSQVLKPHDISLEQFNVLRILRGRKGEAANMQTIQDRMVSKMSNTTRLVDKLINKGLVNRNVCPVNRRKVDIYITQQGLDALQVVDPLMEQAERAMTSSLDDGELQTLNSLLAKIRT